MLKPLPILAALGLAMPAAAQVMTPDAYVKAARAGDLFEIESSRIVLGSTHDPKIRQFADEMIRDHGRTTAEVEKAAAQAKLSPPPPALTPLQAELIAELQGESGPARDATYLAQQRASHNQALDVQEAYATGGTAATLKAAAAVAVPVVQRHIAMLKGM